jgi:hypothetical protein
VRAACAFGLVAALVAATATGAAARGNTTGANFLELGVGARTAAMGDANTAWANDAYGLHYNPAGVARNSRQEAAAFYNSYVQDLSHSYFAYLHPLSIGTLGLSLTYFDLGSVDRTTISSAGAVVGKATAGDIAFGVSYARPVARSVDLGVTLKILNERLDNYSATAGAVDLGVMWRPPVAGLTFGASLTNLGSSLEFVREREPLPLALKLGAGYVNLSRRWGVASDLVVTRSRDIAGRIGGEYWVLPNNLALRAGFNSSVEAGSGFTVGAGFRWEDLRLDYAYVPTGDLGRQHQMSLSYVFGAERSRPEWASDRPASGAAATPPSNAEPPRVNPPPVRYASTPAVTVTSGAYASAFTFRSGDPAYDWIGAATAEVLHAAWRRDGFVAARPDQSAFSVSGEYWVVDGQLLLSARLTRTPDGLLIRAVHAQGDAAQPFAVWTDLTARINTELAALGYPVSVPRPAHPRLSPPVSPLPATTAASAPPNTVPAESPRQTAAQAPSIFLSPIREYPSMSATHLGARLAEAIVRQFQAEGIDPGADAPYRMELTMSVQNDRDIYVTGRVIDRATGIPLGNIGGNGTVDRLDALASKIVTAARPMMPRTQP